MQCGHIFMEETGVLVKPQIQSTLSKELGHKATGLLQNMFHVSSKKVLQF